MSSYSALLGSKMPATSPHALPFSPRALLRGCSLYPFHLVHGMVSHSVVVQAAEHLSTRTAIDVTVFWTPGVDQFCGVAVETVHNPDQSPSYFIIAVTMPEYC